MRYNEKLLCSLQDKYNLSQISSNEAGYSLFSVGKESNKNYIILKNDICSEGEL